MMNGCIEQLQAVNGKSTASPLTITTNNTQQHDVINTYRNGAPSTPTSASALAAAAGGKRASSNDWLVSCLLPGRIPPAGSPHPASNSGPTWPRQQPSTASTERFVYGCSKYRTKVVCVCDVTCYTLHWSLTCIDSYFTVKVYK